MRRSCFEQFVGRDAGEGKRWQLDGDGIGSDLINRGHGERGSFLTASLSQG
jgi:hypothetical protein